MYYWLWIRAGHNKGYRFAWRKTICLLSIKKHLSRFNFKQAARYFKVLIGL